VVFHRIPDACPDVRTRSDSHLSHPVRIKLAGEPKGLR